MIEHNFHVDRSVYGRRIHLFLSTIESGHMSVARAITFERVDQDEYAGETPLLRLREVEAQQLMDALWAAGLRPSEGVGSAGAMKAVQDHLQDMRRLVFEQRFSPGEITSGIPMMEIKHRG